MIFMEKDLKKVIKEVKKKLSEKRFLHSEAVAETAKKLAKEYGEDPQKAYLAGMLHDFAKEMPLEEMQEYIKENGQWKDLFDEEKNSVELLHSRVGALIAFKEFHIEDPEIIQAIAEHTIGGKDISKLSEILYLADYIAPGRKQPGVEEIRKVAKKDFEEALFMAYDRTITYLEESKKWVHPASLLGREKAKSMIRERRRS